MVLSDLKPIHYGYEFRCDDGRLVQFIRHAKTDKYMATVDGKFATAGTLDFVLKELNACLPSS